MTSSDRGTVHIVGAGLAGLAAAVRLAGEGRAVVVHEATSQPGGRVRSYHDQATGMRIDNGTHVILSGNHSLTAFIEAIDSASELEASAEADFPFVDTMNDERWTLRFSDGRIPWWLFDRDRRVPQTAVIDYLPLARLMWNSSGRTVGEATNCAGPIYDRMLRPLLLAALNIDPRQGALSLAQAIVRETLAAGGKACRPLLAKNGIGNALVEPAVRLLQERGVSISLQDELRQLDFTSGRVSRLEFTTGSVTLRADDAVILAVPPYTAAALLPGLRVPTEFRGIVNAHFRFDPPPRLPPMLGIVNGLCEWVFTHPGRISVTISDAGRLFDRSREELAQQIWYEVARLAGVGESLPPWQIVRERRATFAATPEQNSLRPNARTQWSNVFLAGDWTATGLPATMEGAVRSGYSAADLVSRLLRAAA